MSRFNSDMLRFARDLRGVTQRELAERTGWQQSLLSSLENGVRSLTEERVSELSKALDVSPDLFFQEDRYKGLGISVVFYRKRQRTTMATIYRLQAEAFLRGMVLRRMLREVEIKATQRTFRRMLSDEFDSPETVASLVRASWQVPAGPIPHLIGIIENAGGVVFKFPFGTKDIDAMGQWPDDLPPLFFINSEAPADRLRFSLAHELGHVVMHDTATENMESEADRFASELLMPRADIIGDMIGMDVAKAGRLKPYWRCSMVALIRRAHTLGTIGDTEYTRYMKYMSRFGYRKVEPVTIPGEEPRFLDALTAAYRQITGHGAGETPHALRFITPDDFQTRFAPRTGLKLAI